MSKLIVANWKMNPQSSKEAEIIFNGLKLDMKNTRHADVVICPPFPYLSLAKKPKERKFRLGAQDIFYEMEGAYTGEVSPRMLADAGVAYVIIGHSERRLLGDANMVVNKKIAAALKAKLVPILCIGESSRDTNGAYLSFIKLQLHECLTDIPKAQMKNIVIAYEPIWAIGEGALREATPEEFVEMRIFIRKVISDIYNSRIAHEVPILYGGSVHPENAKEFLHHGGADGLLVGRDSLTVRKFSLIINAAK